MATFTLRKVARMPDDHYAARWRLSDASEVEDLLTDAEYAALAQRGAGAPPNRTGDPGATWLHAYQRWKFDTPTGWLEPGDVSDAWAVTDGEIKVQTPTGQLRIPNAEAIGATLEKISVVKMPAGYALVGGVLTVPDKVAIA